MRVRVSGVIAMGVCALLLAGCGELRTRSAECPSIASWASLQEALSQPEYVHISRDEMLACEEFRKIVRGGDTRLYEALLRRVDYPLVALAGFHALQGVSEELGVYAAIRLLLETPIPGSPLNAPAMLFLQKVDDERVVGAALSRICQVRPNATGGYAVVMSVIPARHLWAWYETVDLALVPIEMEAAVLDILYGKVGESTLIETERMHEGLCRLRTLPGVMRATYVMHADDRDEGFRDNLALVLEDEDIDELLISFVALRRVRLIRDIAVDTLNVSRERKDLLCGILEGER